MSRKIHIWNLVFIVVAILVAVFSAQQGVMPIRDANSHKSLLSVLSSKSDAFKKSVATQQNSLSPSAEQEEDLPVVNRYSGLSEDETWTADNVYLLTGTVTIPDGVTLTIEPGTIVKIGAGYNFRGFQVDQGGSLVANGTTVAPIIITSYRDDSVGGDSNGDGASSGQPADYQTGVYSQYGSVSLTKVLAKYAADENTLHANCDNSGGQLIINDNTFESGLTLSGCTSGMMSFLRNEFNIQSGLAISAGNIDPSLIPLAGTNSNTFSGSGRNNTIALRQSTVDVGSTWNVSSDSGATILNEYNLTIDGVVNIGAGVVIKSGISYGTYDSIKVEAGGALNAAGTATDPVIFTSYKDDSVAGDSNGDGTSVGAPGDYGKGIYALGGSVDLSRIQIGNASDSTAVYIPCSQDLGSVTISDSTLHTGVWYYYCSDASKLSMQRNTFDIDRGYAIDSYGSDLSGIDLSGIDENVLNGTGTSRVINLQQSYILNGNSWSVDGSSNAVLLINGMTVEGSLGVTSGTIIKVGMAYGSYDGIKTQGPDANLSVAGVSNNPVIITSYRDDSVGGDSNGDGVSSGQPGDYSKAFYVNGGSTVISESSIRNAGVQSGVYITCSQDLNSATVSNNDLQSGVTYYYCDTSSKLTMQDNTFDVPNGFAIDVYNSDVSGIELSGDHKNVVMGTDKARVINLQQAHVLSGNSWSVDGSSNAVISLISMTVDGGLHIEPGATIKIGMPYARYDGITAKSGSVVDISGSSTSPVTITSYRDDSVGGDSNGDGASTGSGGDYGSGVIVNGGTIGISNTIFKYANNQSSVWIGCSQDVNQVNINDSTFNTGLSYYYCEDANKLTMQRNTFDVANGYAIDIYNSNVTGIVLSGSEKNTFSGTGQAQFINSYQARVPAGSQWTVSGDSGAALGITGLDVYGSLNLKNGLNVKLGKYYASNGITVKNGGILSVDGSSSPVKMTSYRDDSVGGDSEGDGSNSTPYAGVYGSAISAESGSSIDLQDMTIKYATTALWLNQDASLDGVTLKSIIEGVYVGNNANVDATNMLIDDAQTGLEVTQGSMVYRGILTGVGDKGIRACSWASTDCSVDAAYTDWGSASGPVNSSNQSLVCGKVTVSPWLSGSSTVNGGLFTSKNCDNSTTPNEQLNTSAQYYSDRMALRDIDCGNGFQDACAAMTTAQNCLGAATSLAASTSSFPLPNGNAYDQPAQWGGMLADNASDFIQSVEGPVPILSAASFATKLLGAVTTILNVANAYNTCAP